MHTPPGAVFYIKLRRIRRRSGEPVQLFLPQHVCGKNTLRERVFIAHFVGE